MTTRKEREDAAAKWAIQYGSGMWESPSYRAFLAGCAFEAISSHEAARSAQPATSLPPDVQKAVEGQESGNAGISNRNYKTLIRSFLAPRSLKGGVDLAKVFVRRFDQTFRRIKFIHVAPIKKFPDNLAGCLAGNNP